MKTGLRATVILLTMLGCVGCDQATKFIVRDHLPPRVTLSLFHDTVRLERAENPGAFLSLGDELSSTDRRVLFTLGGTLFLAGTAFWALRSRRISPVQIIGAALICGGGLANVIDRVARDGYVTDFLNVGVGPIRTGIFNVADMTLMVGAAMLIVGERLARRLPR
jgi:signal peptidase II